MTFHYPNGKKFTNNKDNKVSKKVDSKSSISYSNRGMTLEEDLNETNTFYLETGRAVIHKKPTPVQIVKVDYPKRSAAVIKEAYFKQASTTDYNGVYNGKYLDFEAKETKSSTSFPLSNFHTHQIDHMKRVVDQHGIAFVIIRFSSTEEVFLLPFTVLYSFWTRMEQGGRKSISKKELDDHAFTIPLQYFPRLDYLDIVEKHLV
ncbi:Holliday junction resolvase [Bacillus coahuilensis m2-6]|uniref:Holliday junction resolvase RecU n=1 Tax=Bacillus coahuilensis TaxID=408580 RepID=UPI0007501A89|nr:Holliday junction resolvase RecU [Bacillus coahuilensis]KUP08025.1 Holliday junction resolvase [Bacillus coahuilensis m2-6]